MDELKEELIALKKKIKIEDQFDEKYITKESSENL